VDAVGIAAAGRHFRARARTNERTNARREAFVDGRASWWWERRRVHRLQGCERLRELEGDVSARDAQSVTLDDVPEFVEERARAKSEERARRIGNLLLAASLLFGVVRRAVDSWRARRAEAKAKAKRPSDDDEEEKENETKEEEA